VQAEKGGTCGGHGRKSIHRARRRSVQDFFATGRCQIPPRNLNLNPRPASAALGRD
jgi:hypothetical protein